MMYYDLETQTLCINDAYIDIAAVYCYKGVYYFKTESHPFNFVTDGKIILGCHNFSTGRGMFIRYKRFRNLPPRVTTLSYGDQVDIDSGLALYKLAAGMCIEGGQEFLARKGIKPGELYSIRKIIEMTKGEYRSEEFAAYFLTDEILCADQMHKGIIPGMAPPNYAENENA